MAGHKYTNPLAFTPIPVAIIVTIVYFALVVPLLVIHETVPRAPKDPVPYDGLNITEAWLDLAELSNGYHHYNTRRNDEVHDWLLKRIETILEENNVHPTIGDQTTMDSLPDSSRHAAVEFGNTGETPEHPKESRSQTSSPAVTIFNDLQSNVSFSSFAFGSAGQGGLPGISVYFEGTNIIVYIRGTEDEEGEWWNSEDHSSKRHGKGGVLVNAHYDSVSTGFGATDDGVGVITVLQLIRYFTTAGNKPKKGVIALLNNGEEDFLNGARAFTQHPMSTFAYTFLNLEGTGPGGRALLFRSTDAEVTKAYSTSQHPFGTVIGADGFKLGLVRSGTDYSVFLETLGLRGLDISFYKPRARYHTDEDNTKHTSVDSLWHMLSTSVNTMKALTSDTSSTFDGPRSDGAKDKVRNGKASEGVWFDLFGKGFAVFGLRGLFAWSVTLLTVTPLILMLVSYLLVRKDKFYFFASTVQQNNDETELVSLHAWKGAFRYPAALIVSSGLTVGCAFFVKKFNPLIIYSSQYAIWSMMLTLWFSSFWFIMKGADFTRPSALHRSYAFLWGFIIGWAILVVTTVFEDRFKIAAGYIFVFYESAIFLATLISFLELFALSSKAKYGKVAASEQDSTVLVDRLSDSDALIAPGADENPGEEPTETTPLFRGSHGNGDRPHATTFANYGHRSHGGEDEAEDDEIVSTLPKVLFSLDDSQVSKLKPYGAEQEWSSKLPTWTWLLQFLLVGPFMIIIVGQAGLLVVEAVSQTGPDGSSLLAPYMITAFFSILLLLPTGPFIHRFSYHIPSFLFLAFVGTLLYSLLAFPFSANNRYKAYFQQTVDLETGINEVKLSGLETYIRPIIATLPSAAGQTITCGDDNPARPGVKSCSWEGLAPKVVDNTPDGAPPEKGFADWLSYSITRQPGENSARITLSGKNTRACVLRFDRPIKDFNVHDSGTDNRLDRVPETGSNQIRLWHREWDKPWTVDVEWNISEGKQSGDEGMEGRVTCLWSDNNVQGVIPALDEIRRYAPPWTAITKIADGLVEGSKPFIV
ncbi:MAG: hypothetical protein M1818_003542 [Claussenomyces sp. TS43310]|nr:MAG: hypothetical protein M1818_003542 [Claussenomyces sp. TS43310]